MSASRDWAIVTGASSGIGRALAGLFAADGINLVLTARKGPPLAALATELEHDFGIKTLVYAADLTDLGAAEGLIEAVADARIRVRYLVNNAGFGLYGPFTGTDWAVEEDMIDVNVLALTYLTKTFAYNMKRRGGGHILNVASVAAYYPGPGMAVYYATKAYVLSFSQAIHEELRESGVSVTALCPGPTGTNFAQEAGAADTGVFKGPLADAGAVAQYGYRAMRRGKAVAVPGVRHRLLIALSRLIPGRLQARLVWRLQGPR